jgi:ribosomal protein S18 acetylase RimI-like enzyme
MSRENMSREKNIAEVYRIRVAQVADLARLAEIEQAAAQLFNATDYAFLIDEEPLSLDFLEQLLEQQAGQIWVAVDGNNIIVGYVVAQEVDGTAYLQELDVHPAHGRRGVGRQLVEEVCAWAKAHSYPSVMLSTFRDIAWNAPFYAKLGFQPVDEATLTPGFQQIRQKEAEAGLPIGERVIMCRQLL